MNGYTEYTNRLRHLIAEEKRHTFRLSRYAKGYVHGLERAIAEASYYHHAAQAAQTEAAIAAAEEAKHAAEVLDASEADLRKAVQRALDRAGCTFEQLAAQAKTGHFDTVQARLAWVGIAGLGDLADRSAAEAEDHNGPQTA